MFHLNFLFETVYFLFFICTCSADWPYYGVLVPQTHSSPPAPAFQVLGFKRPSHYINSYLILK